MTTTILCITIIIIALLHFMPHVERFIEFNEEHIFDHQKNIYCNKKHNTNPIKKYIYDNILNIHDKLVVTDKTKSKFTRNEIDKYRDSQLQFREKIYGTSSPYMDQVDKMNLAQNIKATGITVAEYHDNINKIEI